MEKGNLSKKTEYTKAEMQALIDSKINFVNDRIDNINNQLDTYATVLTSLENSKAGKDLANVENSVFLAKLNSVLPDGDEVSY